MAISQILSSTRSSVPFLGGEGIGGYLAGYGGGAHDWPMGNPRRKPTSVRFFRRSSRRRDMHFKIHTEAKKRLCPAGN